MATFCIPFVTKSRFSCFKCVCILSRYVTFFWSSLKIHFQGYPFFMRISFQKMNLYRFLFDFFLLPFRQTYSGIIIMFTFNLFEDDDCYQKHDFFVLNKQLSNIKHVVGQNVFSMEISFVNYSNKESVGCNWNERNRVNCVLLL